MKLLVLKIFKFLLNDLFFWEGSGVELVIIFFCVISGVGLDVLGLFSCFIYLVKVCS